MPCPNLPDPLPLGFIPSRAYKLDATGAKVLRDFSGFEVKVLSAPSLHVIVFEPCDQPGAQFTVDLGNIDQAFDSLPTNVRDVGDHGWLFVATPYAQSIGMDMSIAKKSPWYASRD